MRERLERSPNRRRFFEYELIAEAILNTPITMEEPSYWETKFREFEWSKTLKDINIDPLGIYNHYLTVLKESRTGFGKRAFFVIELGSISSKRMVKILNILEQNIRKDRNFDARISYEKYKQMVYTFLEEHKDTIIKACEIFLETKAKKRGK